MRESPSKRRKSPSEKRRYAYEDPERSEVNITEFKIQERANKEILRRKIKEIES